MFASSSRSLLFLTLVAVSLMGCTGTSRGQLHPVTPVPAETAQAFAALDPACRDRVHIYFLNGLDPLNKNNFNGLADQVRDLGFRNTTYGQLTCKERIRREIVSIHRRDPQARFVLVGYSFGTNLAASLSQALCEDQVTVDLLVYLGGDLIKNKPKHLPTNTRRILSITAHGCLWLFGGYVWKGVDLDPATNFRIPGASHAQVPTHGKTQELLLGCLWETTVRE